jgi:hypothetical protein
VETTRATSTSAAASASVVTHHAAKRGVDLGQR